jgi:hypothetical protein
MDLKVAGSNPAMDGFYADINPKNTFLSDGK